MRHRRIKLLLVLAASLGCIFCAFDRERQVSEPALQPAIPKIWDDEALATLELPLVNARFSPIHVSSDFYYRIPVRPIYKGYPVYAPGKEPEGYFEWLKNQDPEEIFDASTLKTEEDWIRAGEIVFDAPLGYDSDPFLGIVTVDQIRSPEWYAKTGTLVSGDGTVPYVRYVIKTKGVVELGTFSCAMCHTRVMPDGSVIKGAQGNFPFDRTIAFYTRAIAAASRDERKTLENERRNIRLLFGAPWMQPDSLERIDRMSFDETMKAYEAIPPGVLARTGTNIFSPVQVPDLIGVKDRRYLDRTGLQLHRSVADLMRYATLNQDVGFFSRYGDFIPGGEDGFRELPDPANLSRYSEEQLYALALYIYSLRPPPNPNRFDETAERGQKIFERERCAVCHTPPLYTSNRLIPAEGFKVPNDHREKYDVLPFSVGTDPTFALRTRRGTGYYKVPSLLGVWYRGPFEHNGSVATLEDWFDPRRTRSDYMPTGFSGYGVKTRSVKGHTFGHKLPAEDRAALIAFLRTL